MDDNIIIDEFDGNCPVEAEGWFKVNQKRHPFYFRARGMKISMQVTVDPAKGGPLGIRTTDADDHAHFFYWTDERFPATSYNNEPVWIWDFEYGRDYDAGWVTETFAKGCMDEAYRHFADFIKRTTLF